MVRYYKLASSLQRKLVATEVAKALVYCTTGTYAVSMFAALRSGNRFGTR